MDYYVSLFDGECICLENHCFFDQKSDAIDFFNQIVSYSQKPGLFYNPSVKHVEIRYDNCVLAEVDL